MLIVAHRGGSPEAPDNSAAAFAHGLQSGADLLECDLQLSASGEIVVFHDTTCFGAPVASFTTDELRAIAPTLLTFDALLAQLDAAPAIRLVLDLKSRDVDRALSTYLANTGLRERTLVTSAFAGGLWRLKRRYPDLRTGLSRGATFTRIRRRYRPLIRRSVGRIMLGLALVQMTAFRIETAAFQHELLDRWTVAALHRRGRRVYAWTVDSEARAEELKALGIDYLTTNIPARLIPTLPQNS